jgi:hypothetical protein
LRTFKKELELNFKKLLLVSILFIALTLFISPSALNADYEPKLSETDQDVPLEETSWTLNSPCGQDIVRVCVLAVDACNYGTSSDGDFGGYTHHWFNVVGMGTDEVTISEVGRQAAWIQIWYSRESSAHINVDTSAREHAEIEVGVSCCKVGAVYTLTVTGAESYIFKENGVTDSNTWVNTWFLDLVPGDYLVTFETDCASAETEFTVEVLGIQKLLFTRFSYIYYIVGSILITAGVVASVMISRLIKRKKQK